MINRVREKIICRVTNSTNEWVTNTASSRISSLFLSLSSHEHYTLMRHELWVYFFRPPLFCHVWVRLSHELYEWINHERCVSFISSSPPFPVTYESRTQRMNESPTLRLFLLLSFPLVSVPYESRTLQVNESPTLRLFLLLSFPLASVPYESRTQRMNESPTLRLFLLLSFPLVSVTYESRDFVTHESRNLHFESRNLHFESRNLMSHEIYILSHELYMFTCSEWVTSSESAFFILPSFLFSYNPPFF